MLLYLLFFKTHVFPAPYGRIDPGSTRRPHITGLYTIDRLLTGNWAALSSSVQALILPVGVLAFGVHGADRAHHPLGHDRGAGVGLRARRRARSGSASARWCSATRSATRCCR